VDAAIAVTISSTPVTAIFTGVFFNNGSINDEGSGVTETWDGMAWLRFDNKQPDAVGFFASAAASANARFMVKGTDTPTGMGTLTVGGVDYKIVSVENFTRTGGCTAPVVPESPCATIEFTVVAVDCVPTLLDSCVHHGDLVAFDKSECLSTDPKTGLVVSYDCPLPPISD
jgi:hypothetical protein